MNKRPDPEMIDDENPEWTDEDFKNAVPFSALPESLQAKLRGRPKVKETKERITIRLSRDVVDSFRAGGPGWQTRLNDALREWLQQQPR